MDVIVAVVIGYLIGSIPTAAWLGRSLKGVDLWREGTGNPGAANALRTGGPALAGSVLMVEMAKGAVAAAAGGALVGDPGLIGAGLAAVTGNLYNIWYRFRGGKGLGISAGVLLLAWPIVLPVAIAVIGLAAWALRNSGGATIVAVGFLLVASFLWDPLDLSASWGVAATLLPYLAVGLALLILPKHLERAALRRA